MLDNQDRIRKFNRPPHSGYMECGHKKIPHHLDAACPGSKKKQDHPDYYQQQVQIQAL